MVKIIDYSVKLRKIFQPSNKKNLTWMTQCSVNSLAFVVGRDLIKPVIIKRKIIKSLNRFNTDSYDTHINKT